jgi:hypothetical protein
VNFLHAEISLPRGTTDVSVELSRPGANVMLLDDSNFREYERGRQFSYYGGYFNASHALVQAPRSGRWHLVVDLGGAPGSISANYEIMPRAAVG